MSQVVVQPAECSNCKVEYDFVNPQRVINACGCSLCDTCVRSRKLRTMFTCPTCNGDYKLTKDSFGNEVDASHVNAQRNRSAEVRQEWRAIERQIDSVWTTDVLLSDEEYGKSALQTYYLSDRELDETSSADDVEDEYTNTQYAVWAARLQKLMAKRDERTATLQTKQEEAAAKAASDKKNKPLEDSKAEDGDQKAERMRAATLAQLQAQRFEERKASRDARRLRLLAKHGVPLDVVKKPKKVKKPTDDDNYEPEPEDDEDPKPKASEDDISEILAGLKKTQYKRLSYVQRYTLKFYEMEKIIKNHDKYVAQLNERIAKANEALTATEQEILKNPQANLDLQLARLKNKTGVLNARLTKANAVNAELWNVVNLQLQKLNDRLKVAPGKTRLTKKLATTNALKLVLLKAFYPEQLPPPPVKNEEEEDY